MNVPKHVELAVYRMLRSHAPVGSGVSYRPWRSLKDTGTRGKGLDRSFPCIDIRSSPANFDTNYRTQYVDCSILMGTKVEDDIDHEFISSMESAVVEVCDALLSQFIQAGGSILDEFRSYLVGSLGSDFSLGGIEYGSPTSPHDRGGYNIVGVSLKISYGRGDF